MKSNNPGKRSIEVTFENGPDDRVLTLKKNKKTMYLFQSKSDRHYTKDDMKSLIIDRDETFVNNLSKHARENLLFPRGENALTWNFFRTLTIANRWDVLFDATDIKTGKKINSIITPPEKRVMDNYFWNIMPSTGEFNYKYIKALFYEEISFMGEDLMIEPDFFAFFENSNLLVESKLKGEFDICHKFERGRCKNKFECNHYKKFIYPYWVNTDFETNAHEKCDCNKYNQLIRNLRIAYILNWQTYKLRDVILINVLNEKSGVYGNNLKKSIDFAKFVEMISNEFQKFRMFTITWQNLRNILREKVNKNDRLQRKLLVYLFKHPDL